MSKVLLITGGSRGIGAATARLAADRGWAVAVNYANNSLAADEVVRSIRARGQLDPIYVAAPADLPAALADVLQDGDVLMTQGAGNIGALAKQLAAQKLHIETMKQSTGSQS